MSRRYITHALPANADFFVDLSYCSGDFGSRITGALPSRYKHIDLIDLLSKNPSLIGEGSVTLELLKDTPALFAKQAHNLIHDILLGVCFLVDTASTAEQKEPFTIIDWT
jgi:hypothetical protein